MLIPSTCHAANDPTNLPAGIEEWLKCFFWLVGGVTALSVLWGRLFPKRQPPIEQEFVSKAELEKFCAGRHQPMNEILAEIKNQIRANELKREEADRNHEARSKLIHGRINRLVPVLYTIAGRMKISVPTDPEDA